MEKIVLKDKTEISVNGGTTENQFSQTVESLADVQTVIDCLTEDNLETFELQTEDCSTLTTIENKYFSNAVVTVTEDGYNVTFNLANVDLVAKRLAQLEATQEEQDAALVELAEMVSE